MVDEKQPRHLAKATVPTPSQMKHDLAEAQKSRVELQTRLDVESAELETIKAKYKAESKRVAELASEKAVLVVKLRDREEEIRGKTKLLEACVS